MERFLSGLDQETVIGELVLCVISETRSIKRDLIHIGELADQGESRVDTDGSYSPAQVPRCQTKDTCESTTCKE